LWRRENYLFPSGSWVLGHLALALSKRRLSCPGHFIFTESMTMSEIDTLAATEIPVYDIRYATKQTGIDCNITHKHIHTLCLPPLTVGFFRFFSTHSFLLFMFRQPHYYLCSEPD
jgi:hypothetical protein